MLWPDDDKNAKKPRYSAETGSKLVVTKDNDLQNVKNELAKLKQTLESTQLEWDDAVNKLRKETMRTTELEEVLRQKKEELNQERLSRVNLEAELEAAGHKSKVAEQEQKHLQQQLNDLAAQPNASEQQRKIINLEKTVSSLRAENSRLIVAPDRPPSRTSSIPVSKNRRPRSSSESKALYVEEDLRTCRAELVEAQKKCKAMETKMRKAEADSINLLNEKTAEERKAKSIIEELQSALQEAKDEINALRSEARLKGHHKADTGEQERLRRERTGALEQLETLKVDKQDLERKLSRKTAQCETLQEKLDNLMFSSDNEDLRLELATAKLEATRAKDQLALFKEKVQDFADRRDSLARTRDILQDREQQIESLKEQLDRRESSSVALDQEAERAIQLIHEREDVKDALAKSEARNRYVESQLQFRQHEMDTLRRQFKDCELALGKSRAFTSQQQELYSEIIKSCNAAEARAREVEKELQDLREEMANRSTVSEAAERNQQWKEALERVEALESELEGRNNAEINPFNSSDCRLPLSNITEQADMDAVARLVLGLQRIREERDVLRGSVEFLNLELRAKDAAYEQRLATQRSNSLHVLQSAENDIRLLTEERALSHTRIEELESIQHRVDPSDMCRGQFRRSQLLNMATLIALQRTYSKLEEERSVANNNIADLQMKLQEEHQAHVDAAGKLEGRIEATHNAHVEITQRHDEISRKYQSKCRDVTNLEEKVADLEDEKIRLQNAADEQTAVVRNLERDFTAQTNDFKRLEEAHGIAREELYEARVEADQLRNNHMSSLEQDNPEALAALQRHIEELDQRIIRRNEQIGVHQNDNRRLEMNLRIAENAVDEMRKELEELRTQRVWLEEDAATVRQERNLVEKELDAARCELDALKGSVDAKDASIDTNETARTVEVGALVRVIFDGLVQNRKIMTALRTMKTTTHVLPSDAADTSFLEDSCLLQRFEAQSQELDEAKETIRTLTSDLEANMQVMGQSAKQLDDLKVALNDATARGDTLADQLRRSSELAEAEVNEKMATLEGQIEALSSEVESLEERLAEGQEQVKEVIAQNGELENHLSDLETSNNTAVKEYREKINKLEDQARDLQAQLDQAESQGEEEQMALKDELETAQVDLAEAIETSESLKSQVDALEQEKDSLATQFAQATSDLTSKANEIVDLSRRISEAEETNNELQRLRVTLQEEQDAYCKKSQELLDLQAEVEQVRRALGERSFTLQRCQEELSDALKRLETIPRLQLKVNALEEATARMEKELQEAQQAASAAASTTVRDADSNMRIVQLETIISTMREENEELERVLTIKTKEIDEHDDRLIEVMKDRKKLVAKVDSLNRKIRNMQRQLDAVTGVATADAALHSEATEDHPPSIGLMIPTSSSKKTQMPTPSTPQFESPIHMLTRAMTTPKTSLPLSANSMKPARSSLPESTSQVPSHVASSRPLSSSAPPLPLAAATTPSSALGIITTSASLPPAHVTQAQTPTPAMTTPPNQGSSSRKRRLPDEFDPMPGEQLPAMPVLSTSPSRLRKMLRDGAPLRTGFTPSRSRKSSAAAPDKELAQVAAAVAASLNLSKAPTNPPVTRVEAYSVAPVTAKSNLDPIPIPSQVATSIRQKSSHDQGLRDGLRELKSKPVMDITNTPKLSRAPTPGSLATLSSEYMKPSGTEQVKTSETSVTSAHPAPAPVRYRGGWLNRAAKPSAKSSSSTTSSNPARRALRALDTSPKLGSGALPKSVTGELRLLSRELPSAS